MNRGISPNALVTYLITKFDSWDRFAERFDFLSITGQTFKAFLDVANDDEVTVIAQTVGARITEEGMLFWSKEVSVQSFIDYLNNRCRFAGYGHFEQAENNHTHTIIIHHGLGHKWSLFLHHSLNQVMIKSLGINGNFETSETDFIVRFSSPNPS